MPVNSLLLSFVTGLSFLPNTSSYILFVRCTGSSSSKRITFEATEAFGSARGVYKARYAAPAGTQWSGWERDLTNADIQMGSASVTLTANGITEFNVTFPKAFSKNPSVFVSVVTSRPDLRSASVVSRSMSGFSGAVNNGTTAGTVVVFWVAVSL